MDDHSEVYGVGQHLSSVQSGRLVPRAGRGILLTQFYLKVRMN